jgi:hypothetical protein
MLNFGVDTYGQRGGSLILNSLSDRYGISTFQTPTQSLGTNDYIPENAVKNKLALDGYTHAYDYNPLSTTGYGYNSAYTQPLPTDKPLTKLTFMGLDGDPTKAQDAYVLTSEYNRLSSQGQATSIDSLSTSVANNSVAIANETVRAERVEAGLQSQVNTTNQRVDNVEGRVSNLERLKVMPEASVRFYDSKHLSLVAYDAYDATNGRNFAIGVRVQLKLGKSYEERRIEEQEQQIKLLQQAVFELTHPVKE